MNLDPNSPHPLAKSAGVWGPFMFLVAQAIENLLKGLIIINHPEYVKNGKLQGKVITSHKLINLAVRANFPLREEEKGLCEIGESAIENWGRYPTPRVANKTIKRMNINGEVYRVFDELFIRLSECINKRFCKSKGPEFTISCMYPFPSPFKESKLKMNTAGFGLITNSITTK